jgi:hypothetical protein
MSAAASLPLARAEPATGSEQTLRFVCFHEAPYCCYGGTSLSFAVVEYGLQAKETKSRGNQNYV